MEANSSGSCEIYTADIHHTTPRYDVVLHEYGWCDELPCGYQCRVFGCVVSGVSHILSCMN